MYRGHCPVECRFHEGRQCAWHAHSHPQRRAHGGAQQPLADDVSEVKQCIKGCTASEAEKDVSGPTLGPVLQLELPGYLQGLGSVKHRAGLSQPVNELTSGHREGSKHHALGWSRAPSSPGVHHSVSITFLPTPLKQGEDRMPSLLEPQRLYSRLQSFEAPHFRLSPLPQGSPFLRSLSSGRPLPVIPPSQGVPLPGPQGTRTDSRALTGPATGRSAGQSAAEASSCSTQNRPALPARPAGPSRRM